MKRLLIQLVAIVGLVIAVAAIGLHIKSQTSARGSIYDTPPLVTLAPSAIKILFLGYDKIYQYFLDLWLVQALSEKPANPDGDQMMALVRSILRHRPPVETMYLISCFSMAKTYQRPEACEEIIKVGIELFPESFRLYMTQGFVYYFLMKDPARASVYYYLAAKLPHAPAYVIKVAQRLAGQSHVDDSEWQGVIDSIFGGSPNLRLKDFILDQQQPPTPQGLP